jgi:hypothetical protein
MRQQFGRCKARDFRAQPRRLSIEVCQLCPLASLCHPVSQPPQYFARRRFSIDFAAEHPFDFGNGGHE